MKIKILVSCSGLTFSYSEGQTVDVDKEIGADLVKVGFAEEIKQTRVSKIGTKAVNANKVINGDGDDNT